MRIELSDVVAEIGDFANALQTGISLQFVDDVIGRATSYRGRLSRSLPVQCHVAVDPPDGEAVAVYVNQIHVGIPHPAQRTSSSAGAGAERTSWP